MPVIPLEIMEKDGDFASSSEANIATGVGGSTEISCYVVMIPYFIFSLGVKLFTTYPTDLGVIEVKIIHRSHHQSFFIEIKLHGFLSKLDHLVEKPVNTVFPDVRLVFSIVLREAAEYIEPNRARDLTFIIKGLVTLGRVVIIICFDQRLKVSIYNKWRPYRVPNSVKEIVIYNLIGYNISSIMN